MLQRSITTSLLLFISGCVSFVFAAEHEDSVPPELQPWLKPQEWIRETGDSIPEKISEDSFDRQSGDSLENEKYRFTTPGEDRNASRINHSGPIRN